MRELIASIVCVLTASIIIVLSGISASRQSQPVAAAQQTNDRKPIGLPKVASAELDDGQVWFEKQRCHTCHSFKGHGNARSPLDGVATQLSPEELREWITGTGSAARQLPAAVKSRKAKYLQLCEHCKTSARPTQPEIDWLQALESPAPKELWVPKGCDRCGGIGYFGRTGIFELWHLSEGDYQMILAGAHEHALREHLKRLGHVNLLQDAMLKLRAGVTTLAEVKRASSGAFQQASLSIQSIQMCQEEPIGKESI